MIKKTQKTNILKNEEIRIKGLCVHALLKKRRISTFLLPKRGDDEAPSSFTMTKARRL